MSAITSYSNELFSEKRVFAAILQAGTVGVFTAVSFFNRHFEIIAAASPQYTFLTGITLLALSHLIDSAVKVFVFPNNQKSFKFSLVKTGGILISLKLSIESSKYALSLLNSPLGNIEPIRRAYMISTIILFSRISK